MQFIRRGLWAVAASLFALTAFAQTYPAKPIRVYVPFPAGGGTDVIAREVSNRVSVTQGWNIVIENKPGSGGNLGVDAAAKAPADGYTLALGQTSNLSVNPTLYARMPYDSVKDLTPISLVASAPLVIVVGADSPYKTLQDIMAASKAKPGSLTFASPGNGTVAHLTIELLQKTANVKFTHVPYKGASQATTDLIGGQVQLYAASIPTLLGQIRSGRLRAIAVTSAQRTTDLPQVPTVAESGYKGFESVTWFGFVGPAGIPQPIVTRLNAEINKVLQSPELKKKLSEQGATVLGGTPEQFASLIRSEIGRWSPIVKASGAKLD
ncbi:tripartite tricarboxylate transporter substrate binding protein [Cupriavidus pinatubonensis]|uniref:Bug family tripartite tricarboxylate transporter substrate binding protein n=1 Tax=Cupriavidus pinatubonensis TaxID=248026 RepID=UPI001C72F0E6|nr:tripartite tricarboxylate transporter substrate binding protein [Cupriavidus pinatubonensis]QYY28345.1 tripartite tricarboxylate transporter substrate binding protein [Cupriavidus pinatubonensis]